MHILLMRHGDALDNAIDDSRPLSETGIRQVGRVCEFLDSQSIEIQSICHSQKSRSQQTAEIIENHLKKSDSLRYMQALDVDIDAQVFVDEVLFYQENTLFVGHLPNIQIYLHLLLESSTQAVPPIYFEPATIVVLKKISDNKWELVCAFNPDAPEF